MNYHCLGNNENEEGHRHFIKRFDSCILRGVNELIEIYFKEKRKIEAPS